MSSENKKLVLFNFDGVLAHTHIMCYEIHKELNPDLKYKFFQDLSNGNFIELYRKARGKDKIVDNPNFASIYKNRILELEMPEELKKVIIELSLKYDLFVISSTN